MTSTGEALAAAARARPLNQRRRIAVLRLAALAALPVVLLTRSAWADRHWAFELIENLGLLLVIVAVLGRLWAILYVGSVKNRTVMQDGPYSICRHPLYLFSTLGVVGFGLMLGSFVFALGLGAAVLAVLAETARREERFLRAEFGGAYAAYAARVPRIWPRPSGFQTPATVTSSVRHLRTNLFDALVFLSFIPLAEAMEAVKEAGLLPTIALW